MRVSGSVQALSIPMVSSSARAFALEWSAEGVDVGTDVVTFRVGQVDGRIAYGGRAPSTTTAEALATAAVDKVEGKTVPPIPSN